MKNKEIEHIKLYLRIITTAEQMLKEHYLKEDVMKAIEEYAFYEERPMEYYSFLVDALYDKLLDQGSEDNA